MKMMNTLLALLAIALLLCGCNTVAAFFGADVVTDNIREADTLRHKYTTQYIDTTMPLLEELPDADRKKWRDVGERLKRISEKENKLIHGTWKEKD